MTIPHFASGVAATKTVFINPDISLTNASVSDSGAGAQSFVTIQNDGDLILQTQNSGDTIVTDEWILNSEKVAGVGDDYEVFCSVDSGSLDGGASGATGTWLDMSTSQYSWGISDGFSPPGATITVTIRDKGTETTQASATFTLSYS